MAQTPATTWRSTIRTGLTLTLVVLVATCRPSGCDSSGVSTGKGDAPTQEETIHYTVYRAPERTISDEVLQYDAGEAAVFVLGANGKVQRYTSGSFAKQQRIVSDPPDGGPSTVGIGRPVAIAVARKGDVVAVGHDSGNVALYDTATLTKQGVLAGKPPLRGLGVSGDGKRLVALTEGAVLWDVATRREVSRLEVARARSHTFPLAQLSHDGSRVAVATRVAPKNIPGSPAEGAKVGRLTAVVLWDVASNGRLQVPKTGDVSGFALSQDGTRVVTGDYPNGYNLHDATTGAELGQVRKIDMASLAMSPDGATVAVGDTDGNLWLVDREAPSRFRKKVIRDGGQLSNLRYGAAGRWLYGMDDRELHALDTSKLVPSE